MTYLYGYDHNIAHRYIINRLYQFFIVTGASKVLWKFDNTEFLQYFHFVTLICLGRTIPSVCCIYKKKYSTFSSLLFVLLSFSIHSRIRPHISNLLANKMIDFPSLLSLINFHVSTNL